ncbi:cytochrome b/b6 domain-containing protein [Microbacterium jejuense]|uniref:cytochrome b/b6 domain-containing protein n=1 Tax=Microbacterium jejuense TaxID=1263637 RepID=UPI0027E22B9D|nr:cytochrome b/b6 domain-containing protein [Microbacterium jejuense]
MAASAAAAATAGRAIRRGLPRVPGGEPWPPASTAPTVHVAQDGGSAGVIAPIATPEPAIPATQVSQTAASSGVNAPSAPPEAAADAKALRRGLPRVPGGEPWPPAGFAPSAAPSPAAAGTAATAAAAATTPSGAATAAATPAADAPAVPAPEGAASTAPAVRATATGVPLSQPLPYPRTVWEGQAAKTPPARAAEPKRYGPFTRGQWVGAVIVGGAALLYAAAMAVLAVRWLLSTSWGVDFLARFPGEYHLPEGAPVGFPAWLGWQHFFNVFLMVLIIRTGLTVRTEKRPTVFWSPRTNAKRKISLSLWFHQSLDILWLVNGVIFVVLLFITGQWMRIVPTSWEVFPNALSAALQYVSLDWPTENGWVNYNSLQQLAYFATVFLAAPLAAITGVRMSGVWPKNAAGLNKAYPVEWARAVHFPVMLYFVLFIFVHVVLVFATGALRNLNHMYGGQDAVNWVGFWIFALSMLVIAAAWIAARPLVLAPIARLFGKVSGR